MLAADTQSFLAPSEGFHLPQETHVMLTEPQFGVSALALYCTFADLEARGFSRTVFLAYVTPDADKIMRQLDNILYDLGRIAALLRYGNRINFLADVRRRIADLQYTRSATPTTNLGKIDELLTTMRNIDASLCHALESDAMAMQLHHRHVRRLARMQAMALASADGGRQRQPSLLADRGPNGSNKGHHDSPLTANHNRQETPFTLASAIETGGSPPLTALTDELAGGNSNLLHGLATKTGTERSTHGQRHNTITEASVTSARVAATALIRRRSSRLHLQQNANDQALDRNPRHGSTTNANTAAGNDPFEHLDEDQAGGSATRAPVSADTHGRRRADTLNDDRSPFFATSDRAEARHQPQLDGDNALLRRVRADSSLDLPLSSSPEAHLRAAADPTRKHPGNQFHFQELEQSLEVDPNVLQSSVIFDANNYNPRIFDVMQNRNFRKKLKSLRQLTGFFYRDAMRALTRLRDHYYRQLSVLTLEQKDTLLLRPPSTLLTVGRCVLMNFYLEPSPEQDEAGSSPQGDSKIARRTLNFEGATSHGRTGRDSRPEEASSSGKLWQSATNPATDVNFATTGGYAANPLAQPTDAEFFTDFATADEESPVVNDGGGLTHSMPMATGSASDRAFHTDFLRSSSPISQSSYMDALSFRTAEGMIEDQDGRLVAHTGSESAYATPARLTNSTSHGREFFPSMGGGYDAGSEMDDEFVDPFEFAEEEEEEEKEGEGRGENDSLSGGAYQHDRSFDQAEVPLEPEFQASALPNAERKPQDSDSDGNAEDDPEVRGSDNNNRKRQLFTVEERASTSGNEGLRTPSSASVSELTPQASEIGPATPSTLQDNEAPPSSGGTVGGVGAKRNAGGALRPSSLSLLPEHGTVDEAGDGLGPAPVARLPAALSSLTAEKLRDQQDKALIRQQGQQQLANGSNSTDGGLSAEISAQANVATAAALLSEQLLTSPAPNLSAPPTGGRKILASRTVTTPAPHGSSAERSAGAEGVHEVRQAIRYQFRYPFQSAADHIAHPSPHKPGTGLLYYRDTYSFLPHVVYALLAGRCVFIVASPQREADVRHLVTALWFCVPGHSPWNQVVAWRAVPNMAPKFPELSRIKLMGMSRAVAQRLSQSVLRQARVFDLDAGTFTGAPYAGEYVQDMLDRQHRFPSESTLLAHMHDIYLQLAHKAFLFYHEFCLRTEREDPQVLGLQPCSPWHDEMLAREFCASNGVTGRCVFVCWREWVGSI